MSPKPSTTLSSTEQAIAHIVTHWRNGKTLKEIAELHRLDEGNLARAFRNRHNTTVKRYLDRIRRDFVTDELLRNGTLGYELATQLSFPSDISFYRWAKRVFGVSFNQAKRRLCNGEIRETPPVHTTRKRNKKG